MGLPSQAGTDNIAVGTHSLLNNHLSPWRGLAWTGRILSFSADRRPRSPATASEAQGRLCPGYLSPGQSTSAAKFAPS